MKFCSKDCSFSAKAPTAESIQANRERRNAYSRKKSAERQKTLICGHCSAAFKTSQPAKRYCSDACRNASRRKEITRQCKYCDSPFSVVLGTRGGCQRTFCSKSCSIAHWKPIHKAIRRARERTATIESVDRRVVFRRDDWRCHLCGDMTRKDLIGTKHPLAPEVDHIVPIAKGGEHTYANTACAHRRCNLTKGAKVIAVHARPQPLGGSGFPAHAGDLPFTVMCHRV